jgi:hypothetical protein
VNGLLSSQYSVGSQGDSWGSILGTISSSVDLGPFQGLLQSFVGFNSGQNGSPGFLFPPGPAQSSGLQYPGAGNEPEAQYGGYVYNTSVPVVFSINRAQAQAKTEGVWGMMGESTRINWNELPEFNSAWYKNTGITATLPQDVGSVNSFSAAGATKLGSMAGFTDNNPNFFSRYGGKIGPTTQSFLGNSVSDLNFLPENFVNDLGKNYRAPSSSLVNDDLASIYSATSRMPKWITNSDLEGIGSYFNETAGVDSQGSWKFIIAPEQIQWTTSNGPNRLDMFGTNAPPVVHGSKGMRDLTLGKAIVEGFTRSKQVEDKIAQLELLMNYELSSGNPFVNVPVYKVTANEKIYGDGVNSMDGGYFIFKSVGVDELIRDFTGRATRATVDIEMMQVPAYQVESGIDQSSKSVTGAKSVLEERSEEWEKQSEAARQEAAIQKAKEGSSSTNSKSTTTKGNLRTTFNKRTNRWSVSGTNAKTGRSFSGNSFSSQAEALDFGEKQKNAPQ